MSFWQKYIVTIYIIDKFKKKPWRFVTTPLLASKFIKYLKDQWIRKKLNINETDIPSFEALQKLVLTSNKFMSSAIEALILEHYAKEFDAYMNEKTAKASEHIKPFDCWIEDLKETQDPEKRRELELLLMTHYEDKYLRYLNDNNIITELNVEFFAKKESKKEECIEENLVEEQLVEDKLPENQLTIKKFTENQYS